MGKTKLASASIARCPSRKNNVLHQAMSWRVESSDDVRLLLRLSNKGKDSQTHITPPSLQRTFPPGVKTLPYTLQVSSHSVVKDRVAADPESSLPCLSAGAFLSSEPFLRKKGVRRYLNVTEDFIDDLADAMGFDGPPPPSSRYFDIEDDPFWRDAVTMLVLGDWEIPGVSEQRMTPPSPINTAAGEWSEDNPAPGFTQLMDAPDLSKWNNNYMMDRDGSRERSFLHAGWTPAESTDKGNEMDRITLLPSLSPQMSVAGICAWSNFS